MQKKKEDISGLKLFEKIMFKDVSPPNKYDPLSPKNNFALGKLNNKKIKIIDIWETNSIKKAILFELRFITKRIVFIIKTCIPNKPLKPSIKFAPLIMNKKHNNKNIFKKKKLSNKLFKNIKSTLSRFKE